MGRQTGAKRRAEKAKQTKMAAFTLAQLFVTDYLLETVYFSCVESTADVTTPAKGEAMTAAMASFAHQILFTSEIFAKQFDRDVARICDLIQQELAAERCSTKRKRVNFVGSLGAEL